MSAEAVYRIANWDDLYENAQSRKVDRLRWVPMPNHHDGKTFRRLMLMPDAIEIYGAWALIVQVASKCPTRGTLLDDDGPLLAEELSLKTGGSQKSFEKALQVLSSQRIGWLLVDGSQSATTRPDARGLEGKGMEGIEGNGKEKKKAAADDSFERFWAAFPAGRKTKKGKARESFARACKKHDAEAIIAAAAEYAASPKGQSQWVQGPEPWLNGECWNDDRKAWQRGDDNGKPNRVGSGQQYDPSDTSDRSL